MMLSMTRTGKSENGFVHFTRNACGGMSFIIPNQLSNIDYSYTFIVKNHDFESTSSIKFDERENHGLPTKMYIVCIKEF